MTSAAHFIKKEGDKCVYYYMMYVDAFSILFCYFIFLIHQHINNRIKP